MMFVAFCLTSIFLLLVRVSGKQTPQPPTIKPTTPLPSAFPSSKIPSPKPSTITPSKNPTIAPTAKPSLKPTTSIPTSFKPSVKSTLPPTNRPSLKPSLKPSASPTIKSTSLPTIAPSNVAPPLSLAIVPAGYTTQAGLTTASGKLYSSVASTILGFDISYHGGPFVTGPVNLYNIYYGSTNSQSLVDYFADHVGTSQWFSIMKHYRTGGQAASATVTFKKSVPVSATSNSLSFSAVSNAIIGLFTSGQLPADPTGVYAFIFRGDISFTGWTTNWCGYSSTLSYNGASYKYFVAGDASYSTTGSKCQGFTSGTTANNNAGADSVANIYANQLVKVITDYSGKGFYASTPAGAQANSDLCAWSWGSMLPGQTNANVVIGSKYFLIQQNWMPGVGCDLSDGSFTSAPTENPTAIPSAIPTEFPTFAPVTSAPSFSITEAPTNTPNIVPTEQPTITQIPTVVTSSPPSTVPTTEIPSSITSSSPSIIVPSLSPSAVSSVSPTVYSVFKTLHVPYYTAYNTYSATTNTVPYTFTACPGTTLLISDCSAQRCFYNPRSSDQFIRLYNSTNNQVALNDDSCFFCSSIVYTTVGASCQQYTLQQGCYKNRYCTGNFTIQSISPPTLKPSAAPTVTSSPTTAAPFTSLAPVSGNVVTCPFSAVAGSGYSITTNGVSCSFTACPGMQVTIQDNSPQCTKTHEFAPLSTLILVEDANKRLVFGIYEFTTTCESADLNLDSNDYRDSPSNTCQTYTLYIGCGRSACSGTYDIVSSYFPTRSPVVSPPHSPRHPH